MKLNGVAVQVEPLPRATVRIQRLTIAVDDLLEISGEVGIKSRRVAQFFRVRLSHGDGFGKQATGS